jgi:hypothetical protein
MYIDQFFTDYHAAYDLAVATARRMRLDIGIRAVNEFGKRGFRLNFLPRPENSFGWETRCERITPDCPYIERKGGA